MGIDVADNARRTSERLAAAKAEANKARAEEFLSNIVPTKDGKGFGLSVDGSVRMSEKMLREADGSGMFWRDGRNDGQISVEEMVDFVKKNGGSDKAKQFDGLVQQHGAGLKTAKIDDIVTQVRDKLNDYDKNKDGIVTLKELHAATAKETAKQETQR